MKNFVDNVRSVLLQKLPLNEIISDFIDNKNNFRFSEMLIEVEREEIYSPEKIKKKIFTISKFSQEENRLIYNNLEFLVKSENGKLKINHENYDFHFDLNKTLEINNDIVVESRENSELIEICIFNKCKIKI